MKWTPKILGRDRTQVDDSPASGATEVLPSQLQKGKEQLESQMIALLEVLSTTDPRNINRVELNSMYNEPNAPLGVRYQIGRILGYTDEQTLALHEDFENRELRKKYSGSRIK